jgi:dTDP-4-dehydrorhamnose reductase
VRVLILGGNGMLGHKLCGSLAARADVWATFRRIPDQYGFLPAERQISLVAVEDILRMKEVLGTVKPDAVVNAVGIVKQRDEARQAEVSIRVNALFPHQLSDLCIERGIRAIQFSTDCVFSGARGNYTEKDNPDPVDLYGRSKLLGEVNRPSTLTLRTSIIGWQLNNFTSLLSWFALQRGKRIKGYCQAIYSGLSTAVLSRLIGEILLNHPDLTGIYQVASEPISKYDLLLQLRDILAWKDIVIDPDQDFFCDRSLSTAHFGSSTGWRAPAWDTMLEGLAAEWPEYRKYYHPLR